MGPVAEGVAQGVDNHLPLDLGHGTTDHARCGGSGLAQRARRVELEIARLDRGTLSQHHRAMDAVLELDPASTLGESAPTTAGMVGRTMAEVERQMIVDTLRHTFGNRTHAATILGISIRTLRNKLRDYAEAGVQVPTSAGADRAA